MNFILHDLDDDDLTYILATDADVKFSPNDVMALMDFMSRNPQVASVCGRTYPMGSGPLVWYQMFDYAIGHWLLKVYLLVVVIHILTSLSSYLLMLHLFVLMWLLKIIMG